MAARKITMENLPEDLKLQIEQDVQSRAEIIANDRVESLKFSMIDRAVASQEAEIRYNEGLKAGSTGSPEAKKLHKAELAAARAEGEAAGIRQAATLPLVKATDAAIQAAVEAERDRWLAVTSSSRFRGREKFATSLLGSSNMSAEEILGTIQHVPIVSKLDEAMANAGLTGPAINPGQTEAGMLANSAEFKKQQRLAELKAAAKNVGRVVPSI